MRRGGNVRGPLVQSPSRGAQLNPPLLVSESSLIQKRQSPAAFGALPVNVLLAHPVPYDVVVGHLSPSPTNFGGCAERCGVEEAEDLEAQLVGKGRDEVDFDEVADVGRYEGELWEAASGEDALKHEITLAGGCGRKDGPDVGDALLVGLGLSSEFLHNVSCGLDGGRSMRTFCSCSMVGSSACFLQSMSGLWR
jgi:hypothetical protein